MECILRKAEVNDCRALAELMNIAGEGLPAFLWRATAEPGEDLLDVGARRVAQTEGAFNYKNAYVSTSSGVITGMVLCYRLPDPYVVSSISDIPDVVQPLVELESLAPGAWYVNGIATVSSCRGQGLGQKLMALAEQLAIEAQATTVCLIVAEENIQARRLYEKLHYQVIARRPVVPFPDCPHMGDWLLMEKTLKTRS
ncbi:GNAT family N-acetyltransferase [Marinimicrobium sp. ABcell2]|uniref:GNAT family N-acetyltransferase n=1 Tax=Marinimicrobium sp. ABcell2 TaxID=3069751 RepID=UPI0027B532B3|nr:GNAT family N-acetyltransferase [Marinimicrobium sp. ABcell2]MDQ2076768.1 GNAT family N-acetyltransferase [Marinimicrobium sp. ABcell2]